MHANQFAEFQDRLEQKAAEVADTLRDRRAIAAERMPDVFDEWALGAAVRQALSRFRPALICCAAYERPCSGCATAPTACASAAKRRFL